MSLHRLLLPTVFIKFSHKTLDRNVEFDGPMENNVNIILIGYIPWQNRFK